MEPDEKPPVPKGCPTFEYALLDINPGRSNVQIQLALDAYGEQGWDLAALDPSGREWSLVFQRQVRAGNIPLSYSLQP